jgi:tetratricopeptide (TPR) repeat protein/tRNA A-37 threonylcarbamoyl transferase component Bud32
MGEVYEAEDQVLHERVAIKTIRPAIAGDPINMERFRREVQIARSITHSSVCRVYDVFRHEPAAGRDQDTEPSNTVTFVSMELLEGETLHELLNRQGPLTAPQALSVIQQVAAGLDAAHTKSIVHRDVTSANIIVSGDRQTLRAVVTDFGIACPQFSRDEQLTEANVVIGTSSSMAPEQLRGGELTPATDMYALGILLFEMVTGRLPRADDGCRQDPECFQKAVLDALRLCSPGIKPTWERTIRCCLEPDPARRFPSTQAMVASLHERPWRRWRPALAAVGMCLLAAVVVLAWLRWYPERSGAVANGKRRSVAVFGFTNLSQQENVQWLDNALSEMLAFELATGEELRTIPNENIQRMKLELALPQTTSMAADTLGKIQHYLRTDLLVLGTYFVPEEAIDAKIRFDVRLEDMSSGRTVVVVSEQGRLSELLNLVAKTAARIRNELGVGRLSSPTAESAQAAFPNDLKATQLYTEGLTRLHLFDALGARELLTQAASIAPEAPLVHAALADAWSALGIEDNARREAQTAFELSKDLPRSEQLLVKARSAEMSYDWEQAETTYRALTEFFPDNLEYGLKLARVLVSAGKGELALDVLEALRTQAPTADADPRVVLAQATAAEALSRFDEAKELALEAAAKAELIGARSQQAQTLLFLARVLWETGETEEALKTTEQAERFFAAVNHAYGVASCRLLVGNCYRDLQRFDEQMASWRQALALFRECGSKKWESLTLHNLAIGLRHQGDLEHALEYYQEALTLVRQLNDRRAVATCLGNMALVYQSLGRMEQAQATMLESIQLAREIQQLRLVSLGLHNLSNVRFRLGDLEQALAAEQESLELSRTLGKPGHIGDRLHSLGTYLAAKGDLGAAVDAFEQAEAIYNEIGLPIKAAGTQVLLASVLREQASPEEAVTRLRQAQGVFREHDLPGLAAFIADAANELVQSLLSLGETEQARAALEQGRALAGEEQDVELYVDLASAHYSLAIGDRAAALASAERALARAEEQIDAKNELEAGLLIARLALLSDRERGVRALQELHSRARDMGFGLIAAKAAKLLSPNGPGPTPAL